MKETVTLHSPSPSTSRLMEPSELNPVGTPSLPSLTVPTDVSITTSPMTIALRRCDVRGLRLHGKAEVFQHLRVVRLQGGPWEAGSFSLLGAGWVALSFSLSSEYVAQYFLWAEILSLFWVLALVLCSSVSHSRGGSGRL